MRRVGAGLAVGLVALVGVGFALHRSGALQFNAPDPAVYPITGIDVSHHQGVIDWERVASSGVAFAYLKASEGRDFLDTRFEANWAEAAAAGVPRGAYHFFTFCSPGGAQAAHFLRTVPPAPDVLPPVADVEFVGNCTSYGDLAAVRQELVTFLNAVERAWRVRPILYTTTDALDRVIGDGLEAYPLWIRSVFVEPDRERGRSWSLWQFSDNSRVSGIEGPVDRNALRPGLSLDDLTQPVSKTR